MQMGRASSNAGQVSRARFAVLWAFLGALLALAAPAAAQTPFNSLTLSWTAPGDDGMTGRATSYDLRYDTVGPGTDTTSWWNGATQVTGEPFPSTSGSTDQMVVTGLNQGTDYYFIIRAADEAANWSGYSNLAVGTTQSCSAPASAPGSFTAVADTGQVLVTWNTTSDPLAQEFNLYRATGASGPFSPTPYQNLPVSQTSFLDTNVSPGTTYRYRASWEGTPATCESPFTPTRTVTTPGTPPPTPPPGEAEGPSIQVLPNPATSTLRLVINVTAATAQAVSVRLYDMNGRWIATLADGSYPPGSSEVGWARLGREGERVAPGYYEVLGTVGNAKVRERLILLP
jgi:hypothetical protein